MSERKDLVLPTITFKVDGNIAVRDGKEIKLKKVKKEVELMRFTKGTFFIETKEGDKIYLSLEEMANFLAWKHPQKTTLELITKAGVKIGVGSAVAVGTLAAAFFAAPLLLSVGTAGVASAMVAAGATSVAGVTSVGSSAALIASGLTVTTAMSAVAATHVAADVIAEEGSAYILNEMAEKVIEKTNRF